MVKTVKTIFFFEMFNGLKCKKTSQNPQPPRDTVSPVCGILKGYYFHI